MTLLQISYLISVAEHGSISKAAEELFVSRPTLSRSLHELEDEFGIRLFTRTGSGLSLSEAGRFVYERFLEIRRRSDLLEEQMRDIHDKMLPTASRTVKLCITPALSITLFPRMYAELMRELPDIKLVTIEYSQLQAREMLAEGAIDFHLASDLRWGELNAACRALVFMEQDFVLDVPAGHRLADRASVAVDDIPNEPIACYDQYYYYESYLEKEYLRRGLTPNVVFRSCQLAALRKMVAAGYACSAMPRGALDDGKTIIGIPFEPRRIWTTALIWNSSVQHNTAFYDFLKFAEGFRDRLGAAREEEEK